MKSAVIFGGSGFIGSAIAAELCAHGWQVTVPTRSPKKASHLRVLPTIRVVESRSLDAHSLCQLVADHDVAINLIGILSGDFDAVHVDLAERIAQACAQTGVRRLLHMSALGAEVSAPSHYLQSKARGEHAVWSVARQTGNLDVTVFQPSVVFGAGDNFLNMLAKLCALFPLIPLGSPAALFQPVWVQDVARAFVVSAEGAHGPETVGQSFPLVGPRIYTLSELLGIVMRETGLRRPVIELSAGLANLQALAFEFPPGRWIGAALGVTLTRDNVRSMLVPNVSERPYPEVFGRASELEAIAPTYLTKELGVARFSHWRSSAGR